jgi:nucleotide-binding universal stress UspA family protein
MTEEDAAMIATTVDRPISVRAAPRGVTALARILLAVDGAAASDNAVRAVAALTGRGSAEVFVVHLSDRRRIRVNSTRPVPNALRTAAAQPDACIESAVRILRSHRVRVTGTVHRPVDDIGAAIIESARSLGCSLIAVGTGGRGRLGSLLLGSVARHVIHRADRSVLVAPLSCSIPSAFTRILVAVDGSEYSERAVELAAQAAEVAGAEVVVVHVCAPHGPPWTRYDRNGLSGRVQPADTAASLVDGMVGALAARGLTAFSTVRPARGRPAIGYLAADVLEAAREYDCQMVVVGAHGHTGHGAVLGGVAFQLLHSATVPVLVAR